jgi:hypothetical protein
MVVGKSLNRRLPHLRGRLLSMKVRLHGFICALASKIRAIVQVVDKVVVLFLKPLFQITLVELDLVW